MISQFERGWNGYQGTTKEHAILARSLGVTQLIVAFNKLEKLEWSKERYDFVSHQLEAYLTAIGFKKSDLTFIPISGLTGENLCERSKNENLMAWYGEDSPCLLEVLDSLRLPQRTYVKPLRATISEYCPKS
jgi:elongation factor 1 alpha-like protein